MTKHVTVGTVNTQANLINNKKINICAIFMYFLYGKNIWITKADTTIPEKKFNKQCICLWNRRHYNRLCDSDSYEVDVSFCLRPVVSLPSSIPVGKVQKKTSTVKETWNDPLEMY